MWQTEQNPRNISEPTNGAESTIQFHQPYTATIKLQGSSDILFHRWNNESVKAKAESAKGSKAKRSDDLESYVWRNEQGEICIPGEYLRMTTINAAKFRQDPRSPRKSAMDLFKAGIVALTNLAPIYPHNAKATTQVWDYEDARRVTIQRNGITRIRPAFRAGWTAQFEIMVNLPEYIDPNMLRETIEAGGRLVGLADMRPTFGRYGIVGYSVLV